MCLCRFGLLIAALTFSAVTVAANDDKVAEVVKAEVKKMVDATVAGKYEIVMDLTHPKILDEMGGKEKAEKTVRAAMEKIKAQGIRFEGKQIDKPTVVNSKGSYYSVTSYTMIVSGSGKKVTVKSALVGVSTDEGKTWKFINQDVGGEAKIRQILPNMPRDLIIPKQEQKVETVP